MEVYIIFRIEVLQIIFLQKWFEDQQGEQMPELLQATIVGGVKLIIELMGDQLVNIFCV